MADIADIHRIAAGLRWTRINNMLFAAKCGGSMIKRTDGAPLCRYVFEVWPKKGRILYSGSSLERAVEAAVAETVAS